MTYNEHASCDNAAEYLRKILVPEDANGNEGERNEGVFKSGISSVT
jgi:hypothetical protein